MKDFKQEQISKRNNEYNAYIKKVTPKHSIVKNCFHAFVVGGIICVIGQAVNNYIQSFGITKDEASLWTILILILISDILTCLNLYPGIVKWGGAGALVPITGFANGVCAPAMEFKKEGWVFGTGARIFQIAGPVILYGIVTSWVLGVVYLIFQIMS